MLKNLSATAYFFYFYRSFYAFGYFCCRQFHKHMRFEPAAA